MNKAYLLVICLLAASFTGCLADDKTTDEKIEPTGGSDDGGMNSPSDNNTADKNGTANYDELIGEIQNLTDEIEELRLEIEELQASEYQPPENSNFTINDYDDMYDEDGNKYWKITPQYRYIKEGHTLIIEYLGSAPNPNIHPNWFFNETELYCGDHFPSLAVYSSEGVKIDQLSNNYGEYADGNYEIENLCEYRIEEQWDHEGYDSYKVEKFDYWSRITKTFDEEPVRIGIDGLVYTFQ